MSRLKRWSDAVSKASEAIEELIEIQEEYKNWFDNLPENLQSSSVGDKLEAVCDIEIEEAYSIIEEASDAELPLGYGKD